jgi:hypothetical protein
MLIFFRTASPNEKRLAPPRIISILGLCVGVTVQALGQSSPPATVPVGTAGVQSSAVSEQSVVAAAKDAAQNPVAAAISVPFQNNTCITELVRTGAPRMYFWSNPSCPSRFPQIGS